MTTDTPKDAAEIAENENVLLAEHIRARRTELNMGVRELARATGLSATFISNLEHGKANPTLDTLRNIANALDTPVFRLLVGRASAIPWYGAVSAGAW